MMDAVCHRDGSVSYWSVHRQRRVERTRHVPDEDLAALPPRERERILRHVARRVEKGGPDD